MKNTLSADFCADQIDVIANFAVITNVVINRVHCITRFELKGVEIKLRIGNVKQYVLDVCSVWQHTFVPPSAFSRRAVASYWRKYVHEVLVNRLGGLSLPRKSVVRLTDRPDMTLDVYRGRKTTMQCNNA